MKKLALTAVAVAIVLVGFIAVLYCLPSRCCGMKEQCEMKEGDKKCSGHEGCEMKERHTVKIWTDADGKTHREEQVMKGDENGMEEGGCPMHGDMQMQGGSCSMHGMQMQGGSCSMHGMQMQGGCCCCCMMMCGGMKMDEGSCCKKGNDSAKSDSAVHVKVRGKL